MTDLTIALASKPFVNGDVQANLATVLDAMAQAQAQGASLLCFGEAFLQGFDSLTWDYAIDRDRAVTRDCEAIRRIREASRRLGIDVALGYIERADEVLYSSYLLVEAGEATRNYRRISRGWKEYYRTDEHYREGDAPFCFPWRGRTFCVALCGDLWDFSQRFRLGEDVLLWPIYCDYAVAQWQGGILAEYARQCAPIAPLTLMINSICPPDGHGGCAAFRHGEAAALLPPGQEGLLLVPLNAITKGGCP